MAYETDRDIFGTFWQLRRPALRADADAMRRITSRFVMLIATAAVAPLVIYGAVSISNLREGTRESVDTRATSASPIRSPSG